MQYAELMKLVEAGDVESVVISRMPDRARPWEVDVYGGAVPSWMNNALELARGGPRQFATIEAALDVVRAAGYTQMVQLDG